MEEYSTRRLAVELPPSLRARLPAPEQLCSGVPWTVEASSRETSSMPTYRIQGPHDVEPYAIEATGFEHDIARDSYIFEDVTTRKGKLCTADRMPLRLIGPPVEL